MGKELPMVLRPRSRIMQRELNLIKNKNNKGFELF
jgi:hypothetical protein